MWNNRNQTVTSPLHLAAQTGNLELFQTIAAEAPEGDFQPTFIDNDGRTPLALAEMSLARLQDGNNDLTQQLDDVRRQARISQLKDIIDMLKGSVGRKG